MEKYLKTLLEQVRCKKAHSYIEEEIRGHMEEQIKTNLSEGMTHDEAIEEAIRDMGSPVEAGIALDQIHRPRMAWDMVILMGIISLFGIIIHTLMGPNVYGSNRFAIHTMIGFVLMLLVYRLDYSFMAKFSKIIATIMLGVAFLSIYGPGAVMINGATYYISFAGIHFSIFAFLLLYVPVYAAVIYQYYGMGMKGIVKALLWMIVPVLFATHIPSLSLAVILFFSMAIVLSLAVYKGWFKISKKKFFLSFWGISVIAPVLMVFAGVSFRIFADYQIVRIKGFITNSGEVNYLTDILRTQLLESRFIGGNGRNVIAELPEYNNSFVFNYITSSYGIVLGVFVCAVLALLITKIFMISLKQKNQLGMMMGCGCGTVLLINAAINILQNIGLLPLSQSFLPFFSYGGSFIVVSYVMIGIVLSIYRYKNIFPIRFKKKKKDYVIKISL